jgi:dipeptidyl aminopeptidase/acylaminoacyl peptidase
MAATATRTSTKLTADQILAIRSVGGSEAPQWSPDGSQIIFATSLGGSAELWSVSPQGGPLTRLTVGMGGVGHLATFMPMWSPTGNYISYVSAKTGADEVWLWSPDGSADVQLTHLGARIEAMCWAPDGNAIAVASNAFGTFDIFRVEVPSGATRKLTSSPLYEVYPYFTPDGRILYVRLNDTWTDHEVILVNGDGSEPRVVLQDTDFFDYHYGRTFNYPRVSPDGRTFLFKSDRSGRHNIWVGPVEGGGEPRRIAPAEADQTDAVWSPDGRSIAYVENHNGTLDLRVVDAAGGEPRVVVAPDVGVCHGPAWSPDGTRLSYLFGSVTTPNDVYVVDLAGGATTQLTQSMLGGAVRERLTIPEKVVYESVDGLQISAYVYHPANRRPGEKFPGIMWIHGGPTSQFMDTFQPQVEYFVQAGYVVMLPNIRGSSGYGRRFEDLNNKDWGHGDLQDVIAGVEYLKTLDDVDPENFGITGTSYGGIMSMDAVAFAPPGVFKASIACSGYGDFLHMAGEQELRHLKLLEYELGDPERDKEVYYHVSSIYHLENATIPCFLLHGEGRYPGSTSSIDFALALEALYKPFWYKAYPGETYYVSGAANVKRQLRDMQDFFDLYLKGIPYNRPDDGTRPLTHLSGTLGAAASSRGRGPAGRGGAGMHGATPPPDVAN